MPKRIHTAEKVIGKLHEAEVVLSQGQTVGQVSRALGISEQTYYRPAKVAGSPTGAKSMAGSR